jgi:hypothetical protein
VGNFLEHRLGQRPLVLWRLLYTAAFMRGVVQSDRSAQLDFREHIHHPCRCISTNHGNLPSTERSSQHFPGRICRPACLCRAVDYVGGNLYLALPPFGGDDPCVRWIFYLPSDPTAVALDGESACTSEGASDERARHTGCLHVAAHATGSDRRCGPSTDLVLSGVHDRFWEHITCRLYSCTECGSLQRCAQFLSRVVWRSACICQRRSASELGSQQRSSSYSRLSAETRRDAARADSRVQA